MFVGVGKNQYTWLGEHVRSRVRVRAFIPISENAQHSMLSTESSELDGERYESSVES
jgi:hypothetical protein